MSDGYAGQHGWVLWWRARSPASWKVNPVRPVSEAPSLAYWSTLMRTGYAFLSPRDNLDLSTPSGWLRFQVVGAMAEFGRALTQERVRAGLRLARSKGKRLGRHRAGVNPEQVAAMRATGVSWRNISERPGIGVGTAVGHSNPFQKPCGIRPRNAWFHGAEIGRFGRSRTRCY
jgi:hypothetical protein